jgi:anaerobic selenocysteine-containing dehydrogenase
MELLGRRDTRDGVVVPFDPSELAHEIEHAATRPVEAVEMRAVAAQSVTAGSDIQSVTGPEAVPATAEGGEEGAEPDAGEAPSEPSPSKPPMLTVDPLEQPSESPRRDAYAVRLVSARKLYDAGAMVQHCSSLAHLAARTCLHMNSHDLDRLGVHTGDRVKVSSPRAAATVEVLGEDRLPRGSASLTFNAPGDAAAADLIDATQPVTELHVETVT